MIAARSHPKFCRNALFAFVLRRTAHATIPGLHVGSFMLLLATWQANAMEVMNLKPAEYVDNSGGYCSLSLMSLLAPWKNGVGRGCREFRVVLMQ